MERSCPNRARPLHSLRTIAFAASLSGIFLLAALWPTPAPAQDKRAATRADVAEKKSDLKELRDQIDALRKEMAATEGKRDEQDEENSVTPEDSERQQSMVARLDDYVAAQKPFLDPDLTLARLARKLTVPAKQLSSAINRVKGENVSRYINRHRIEHACGGRCGVHRYLS